MNSLKNTYEDEWKKNNEINTSIKLPLTISIDSTDYKKIVESRRSHLLVLISYLSFYILNFNNEHTQYKIIYNGSPKKFFNDMSNRNFDLNNGK